MASRALVIGLDCAPPQLVFERWREELPTLRSLMERGRYGVLRSCDPPITVPAWACMTSSRVFITNGPIQATGSPMGRPPRIRTSRLGLRLSWIGAAAMVNALPWPKTASWPVAIGRASCRERVYHPV